MGDFKTEDGAIAQPVILMCQTSLTEAEYLRLDSITGALAAIDVAHRKIHEGNHYFVSGYETEANAGTIEFIFTTPNTTIWSHMTFSVIGTENIQMEVYEGATGVVGGASATPINNNRNSTNTSTATVTKDPTSIAGDGTLIDSYSVGATGAVPSATGNIGMAERGKEIILKQNTTYLFRITSGAADNIISYKGSWYEHVSL